MDILIRMLMAVLKDRKHKKQRRVLSTVLAAVVVFMTTYSLILPAITLEESTAETTDGIFLESADVSEADPADDDVDPSGELLLTDDAREESAPASDGWEDGLIEDADWEENGELADIPDEPALTDTGDETEEAAETETGNVYAETEEATEDTTESEESVGEGETESELEEQYPEVEFSDSTQYTQVKVYAPEGAFPEGTQMLLSDVEDDETIAAICDAALAENSLVQKVHAVDISFRNSRNEEIEPLLPIRVEMTAEKCAEVGSSSVSSSVVHVDDSGNATIVENAQKVEAEAEDEKDADKLEDVETIAFEAKEFSVYALVYTVDFHWEVDGQMYEFSLPGGGFISFSDLIEVLGVAKTGENDDVYLPGEVPGINDQDATGENGSAALTLDGVVVSEKTREFVADVKSVVFSSPELVDVSKVESETTVGGIKESRGLDVQYSAELTEEQIAEINAQTVVAGDWALISVQPFESTESLTVTMKTGEVFEIRVTDAQLKKTVKTASGETWEITITYDDSAEIPKDAELRVEEILPEDERYEQYYQQSLEKISVGEVPDTIEDESGSEMIDETAETASEEAATTTSYAHIFDIQIWAGDQQIEPASGSTVSVSIKLLDAPENEDTNLQVVHFGKDGLEVMELAENNDETKAGGTELNFVTDEFSVYAIVGTELYTEIILPGSSDTYVVTVTAPAEAKIPQGSTLRVEPFEEGSEKYEYARNAVLADKKEKGEFVDIDNFGLAALDISIIDPDGNEIEPAATVQVDIKIKNLPGVEDLSEIKESLEIQHHVEVDDGVVVEKVFDGSDEGSFQMNTNDKVIEEGTAVDPNSVNDEDFRIDEEESTDIDASFNTEVFSTFTISWNGAYGNGVVVHYVDEDGTELNVANSVFPTTIGNNTASPAHLIYDIDGYEYDHTYRRYYSSGRWDEQNIVPELRRYYGGWAYSTNNSWYYLSASTATNKDEIYVVYKKKPDITQGGSPTLKPVRPEDYPDKPSILKESDPNGDGTSDLSLSITGYTKDREVEKLADVIVVFDVSGSMSDGMSGSTRLAVAKNAVNNLVDNLAEKKNSDGNPLVRMSLISFSNTAESKIGLTDLTTQGVSDYKAEVGGLSAGGGTNWDYALQLANEQAVDSGRATFVIFVTDGDPTFRNARTNINDAGLNGANNTYTDINESYYFDYHVFGTGSSDNRGNNYDAAVAQGKAIVGAKKNLYTIGISNDVEKVSDFNEDAGGNGAYRAADAAALNQAFADIEAAIIAKLGISDIQMTDGITEMTQTVDKSGLTTTDGSFTYRKKAKNATTFVEWDPASEGCLEAEYDEDSGAVKWNMGTDFMPEDGATYKVTWKVWPSQNAYDILAKCMNDPSFYDTLTDAQKAQIARTGSAPNYSYTLRTNEPGAGTTYKSATKSGTGITTEGEAKELPFNEVNPLGLASSQIGIRKIWDNQLDGNTITGSYTFPVKADGTDFGKGVVLSSPNWQNTYYISTGLMTTDPYVVYEHGHDYKIEEPSDLSYQWDFKSDVYHPMVINNQTKILIKVDTQAESDYTIDGKYYKELSGETVLTATNERRSNLNISKTVVDKDGNHIESDQTFTFTVTVDEGHDDEVWLSAYDTIAGETVKDSSIVSGTGVQYQESDGYFHAPSGTTLTLKLKDGWNYRFTNLSVGSTYSIEENSPVPDGYSFVNASATATNGATAGTVTGQKTEGTVDKSNSVYTAAYTNRANTTTLKFRKTEEDGTTPLAGAVIEIVKDSTAIDGSPFTTTTEDIELTLFDGIYRVKETTSPSGYVILNGEMYFKAANGVVTITDQDGNEKTYGDFTMDTENGVIVLKLKNHPGDELPNTGGSGTLPYTLGGLMLIIASALMYGFRMRRRERRLN